MVCLNMLREDTVPPLFRALVFKHAAIHLVIHSCSRGEVVANCARDYPVRSNAQRQGPDEGNVLRTDTLQPLTTSIGILEPELVSTIEQFCTDLVERSAYLEN